MSLLTGKRILVVEDEALISTMVEDMLTSIGISVIGPATTILSALELVEKEIIDAAVLDVNVRGQTVEPVAERLMAKGVPILFATGYSHVELPPGANTAIIDKPYTLENLIRGLTRALGLAAGNAPETA